MSFKIYSQDLKVTREGLVTFKFEIQSLKVEEAVVMTAYIKIFELFYRTVLSIVSILFCLKPLTLQFKVT